jgi:hypothetical protein
MPEIKKAKKQIEYKEDAGLEVKTGEVNGRGEAGNQEDISSHCLLFTS